MDNPDNKEPQAEEQRRDYEPPAVVAEHTFENLSLTCAQASPIDINCQAGPISS